MLVLMPLLRIVIIVVRVMVALVEYRWGFFFPISILRYMMLHCDWEVAPKPNRIVAFPGWKGP